MDSSEVEISSCPREGNDEKLLQKTHGEEIDRSPEGSPESRNPKESSVDKSWMDAKCDGTKQSFVDKKLIEVGEQECERMKDSPVDKYVIDIDGEQEGPRSPKVSSATKCEAGLGLDSEQECQNKNFPNVDIAESENPVKYEASIDMVPKLGLDFESEEQAYMCYSRYAVLEGFSIRKDFVNKSRVNGAVVSRRFTCFRQGYRPGKHEANLRKPRQETRTGCLAHMTIARQPNGKFRVTHFENNHNHEFVTQCTAHMLPSQKRLSFAQAVEADTSSSSMVNGVPTLGMGFDSEDHAYEFYNTYAGRVGFSVRKDYVNRSKIDGAVASRRSTCFREGFRQKDKRDLSVKRPRKETRIGCLAQLVIARQPDSKYRVTHFEEKHNHELVAACRVRMLRSQKRLAVAQEGNVADGSRIQPTSVSELACNSAGEQENLGYNPIDYTSKLSSKRMTDMREGEADSMLPYFQSKQSKNASFVYAIQLDAEDQITNIFWADSKMVIDYSDFGDVVCFDMTYRIHRDSRPFAPLVGVNHHKQMVIFGAAFLYDETVESFKWLFRTFIEALSGKKPKTILTDQDARVAEAVAFVMPETHHRTCVWHVYQNALVQLSLVFAGSSSFANDFSCCIFNQVEQGYIDAWKAMLDRYGLWENEWLHEIFEDRGNWAIAYGRHIFCADILSAQLCEGFPTNLQKYLKSDFNVLQFFKQLGKVVNDWHYKELEANYDMSQQMARLMGDVIMLKHARDAYTPKIFHLFQQEFEKCLNIVVNQCSVTGSLLEYKVSTYEEIQEYTVTFNSSDSTVGCNCMKFEFMGVLCSHALKVLDYKNIKVVPLLYILKRWTKDARI